MRELLRHPHIRRRHDHLCEEQLKLRPNPGTGLTAAYYLRKQGHQVTITRVAITTEADAEKKGTEMGRKYIVPYALYRCEGYVSANLARKVTGFSEDDLRLLWQAILNMFEYDRSAARGKMAVRELIVFKHDTELGCAPAWKLFDTVSVAKKDGVISPRAYDDYTVTVNEAALPAGVACQRMG